MSTLFADTNYWVALVSPRDNLHEVARQVSEQKAKGRRILTTDFVLIEFCRLLGKHGAQFRKQSYVMVKALRDDPNVEIEPASRALFNKALDVYHDHLDKDWDIVDCASYVLMRERGLTDALTHDVHFRQMGFTALLKDAMENQ